MRVVEGLIQGTVPWLQFRQGGIGSSDIAKIMDKSPWGGPMDVFREKSGLAEEEEPNEWMKRGTEQENTARKIVERRTRISFKPVCIIHDKYPYFIASLDGFNEEKNCLLEIKVPGKKVLDMARVHEIPDYYLIQIQWQLLVSGCEWARYAVYNPDSEEFFTWCLERDEELIEKMHMEADCFWQQFLLGNPPEEDIVVIDDKEALKMAHKYITYDITCKYHEQEKKAIKEALIELGDDGDFRVGRLTFRRTQPRKTYDIDAMKIDGIDIEKYVKKSDGIGFYTVKIEKE